MDDTHDKSHLLVHLILGNSAWPRISTSEPQHVGREWTQSQVTRSWAEPLLHLAMS